MKLIVIGHGMVGHKFLETLCGDGGYGFDVTVLCEEPRPAYDRVHLSEFFAGRSADELSLVAPGFFERTGVNLKLNAKAASVDRAAKTVLLADGEVLGYDKLVFATGSSPFVPPVPGRERAGCFVYRTIEDLEAMQACGVSARSGVVIGGGLLGLECAKALRDMQLDTHVVEFAPRLMAVQVDELGGRMLRSRIEELGVTVHTQKNTLRIVDGESSAHRMEFADGSFLETDMIVFSAGIRPREPPAWSWARAAVSRSTTPASPPTRTSTRSASARPGTARPSAWSPPATTWRAPWPARCSARKAPSPAPT
jgi:nitrite reductase (NADH) large subunit